MNNLQEQAIPAPASLTAPATRPFTRTLNVFYDAIKPKLYNKVDRSVLDALVRQLEGYHQHSVALMIPELAAAAGVSPWSTTYALARLEKSGVIVRQRKKMRKTGRYIWELALPEPFRVIHGTGPAAPEAFSSERPARSAPPAGESPEKSRQQLPLLEPPAELPPRPTPARSEPAPARVKPESRPSHVPELAAAVSAQQLAAREPESPEKTTRPRAGSEPLVAAPTPAKQTPVDERPKKKKRAPLTEEQLQSLERLRELRIDYWMARKLARKHSPELIDQVVRHLRGRVGTVRNPAAWVVRELERGGYAAPPVEQEETRKQERAAREQARKQAEAHQAELAEQATQRLLQSFRALSPERQRELEHQVRVELQRVSPRLAEAPLELDSAGPVRSKLLELLEVNLSVGPSSPEPAPTFEPAGCSPKPAGFTPRRGQFQRSPALDVAAANSS